MKHPLSTLAVALIVLYTMAPAQESKSTTRLEKQHTSTHFMKEHLQQIEANLVGALVSMPVEAQREAIQTLRDMEQLFPEYPFEPSIRPLGTILKDEASDPIARRLAALALDELHSDAGDAVIKDVANKSDDKGLQTLCQALLVKNINNL
jgi:hypothetical protein